MDAVQMGGDLNELMTTKRCSPLMIYLAVIVVSGLSVYITRTQLKRHNTSKMDNLFNLYSLNELKFMIVLGLIIFGLCQYNKSTLAWVFLIFPVIYLLIQNLIVHIHVSSAVQSSPKPVESKQQVVQELPMPPAAPVVPRMQPPTKTPPVEMPMPSSMSQPLDGSAGQPAYASYF